MCPSKAGKFANRERLSLTFMMLRDRDKSVSCLRFSIHVKKMLLALKIEIS